MLTALWNRLVGTSEDEVPSMPPAVRSHGDPRPQGEPEIHALSAGQHRLAASTEAMCVRIQQWSDEQEAREVELRGRLDRMLETIDWKQEAAHARDLVDVLEQIRVLEKAAVRPRTGVRAWLLGPKDPLGTELTRLRLDLERTLAEREVRETDDRGTVLDPLRHIVVEVDPRGASGRVTDVVRSGWTLRGRPLRPAEVKTGDAGHSGA